MPSWGPVKRKDLIRNLIRLGFEGPFSGGRHQFMLKGNLTVRVPNPHSGDICTDLLIRILRQAGVTRDEWESL